ADLLAPASVTAQPGGEALVVARAAGTVVRLAHRLGDTVRGGEALAWVDSLDAAAMAADRSVAEAHAALARKTYARELDLYRQGVTPRQEMEAAQSALAVAEAEARRATTVARAVHVAGDGRSVAVVSPIDGRVAASRTALGAFVAPQDELFRIARPGAVQVEAAVAAAEVGRIAPGDAATILAADGAPLAATVLAVTPTASGSARSATVVVGPATPTGALVAGQGVQVRLHARSGGGGLAVPEDAVQNLDGRDVLFVRTAEGFRAQPVRVGTRSGGMAQIVDGVRAGEAVATRNAFLVKAEMNKGAEEEE
ncbi:efflux RND transporter periplasmic adaptor subunit, partial [Frateuria defendens]|uniref:efflux RND transporter periplasmic adaptor subunit n=1 Tax=Frateuria defendens TaxID=2219559 RepID=UPI00066FBF64